jgi:hypothetical protein
MQTKTILAGNLIFKEGDRSEFVFVIKSGNVEIVRSNNGEEHIIARLLAGDVVGEMAALGGLTHSASARAATDVEVDVMDRVKFVRSLESDPAAALTLLKSLIVRLRETDLRLMDARSVQPARLIWAEIHLLPDSERMAEQMPPNGLIIRNLPFRIGRHSSRHEALDQSRVAIHLAIEENQLHFLDRVHFAIEDADMGPIVRDCGSKYGTIVNELPLGGTQRHLSMPLRLGVNKLVAGPSDSPFRFLAVVQTHASKSGASQH